VLLAYVLSFVLIGIYWNNHHHMLAAVTRISGMTSPATGQPCYPTPSNQAGYQPRWAGQVPPTTSPWPR
jgi:hypothetical protein